MSKLVERGLVVALVLALTASLLSGCNKSSEESSSTSSAVSSEAASESSSEASSEVSSEPSSESTASSEESSSTEGTRTFYESTFTASGTKADTYNKCLDAIEQEFLDYYSGTGELDKVEGYDEPITVTSVNQYSAAIEDMVGQWATETGETLEANRWTDAFKRIYNIDIQYNWWAQSADYTDKLRLDMAAGDIPDIFLVRNQSDLYSLAEQGLIWDMTDIVDQYASDYDKEAWQTDGGAGLQMGTINGCLYGVPCEVSSTDEVSYLWLRKDWMENLGLSAPTTMDDLTAIMDAFTNQDPDGNGVNDTWGIYLSSDSVWYSLRGIFEGFNSYPTYWIDKDGSAVYGGIQDETKDALVYLNSLYEKGYINPEFVAMDGTAANQDLLNNKIGLRYGGHWEAHTFMKMLDLYPDADWESVAQPTATGEPIQSILKPNTSCWIVVNKNFEHPEIALKMRSVSTACYYGENCAWWWFDHDVAWQTNPVWSNVGAWDNLNTYLNCLDAYENGESVLQGKGVTYWANLHGENQWAWEHMFGQGDLTPMYVLNNEKNNGRLFWDVYHGPQTELMNNNWSTIQDQQLQMFTNMIIGAVSVDEGWQQWTDTFASLSGNEITQEVNDWYAEHK